MEPETNKPFLSIITPTYNRRSLLPRLYDSLCKQTVQEFVWIVVDDGSADDSANYVQSLIGISSFPIEFICQTNQGKHAAVNNAVKIVDSTLSIIVDSDDYLAKNAVATIKTIYEKYKDNKEVGVFAFQRCTEDGATFIKVDNEFVGSYITYRIAGNLPGDMEEVFYSHILRKHPFPRFEGEKFLSEDVTWIDIGIEYKYVFLPTAIAVSAYLSGGLTANDKKMKFASPRGSALRGKQLMKKECGIKANIKGAIIYDCYIKEVEDKETVLVLNSLYEKLLTFFFKPAGAYFRCKWMHTIER